MTSNNIVCLPFLHQPEMERKGILALKANKITVIQLANVRIDQSRITIKRT
jgi:hypothetical protein